MKAKSFFCLGLMMIFIFSSPIFADDSGAEEKINTIRSNVDRMVDFEPEDTNSDRTIEEGLTNLEASISSLWNVVSRTLKRYSGNIALIISVFSFVLFFIFKAMQYKAGQKTAFVFIFMPIVTHLMYTYISAFISMIQN